MEPQDRAAEPALIERLLQEPHRFSFFQIVQLLEKSRKDAVRVGGQGPASGEILRFRPPLSFAFPNADVEKIEVGTDAQGRRRYHLDATFLGLYGTVTPLPNFYTEELLHDTGDESILRDFLDIFHHRLYSLFYRCWEKYRHYVRFRDAGRDEFTRMIFCLAGLGVAAPPAGAAVPAVRILQYTGLFTQLPPSAEALKALLADYFAGPGVEIAPFALRWIKVPETQRNRIGIANCRLGRELHVGAEVRDRAGKFRVTMGPTKLPTFMEFLPGGMKARAVDELVRLFVRDPLQYEIEVLLERDEVPELRLHEDSVSARLGQTTWFGKPGRDASVVFQEPRRTAA